MEERGVKARFMWGSALVGTGAPCGGRGRSVLRTHSYYVQRGRLGSGQAAAHGGVLTFFPEWSVTCRTVTFRLPGMHLPDLVRPARRAVAGARPSASGLRPPSPQRLSPGLFPTSG